VSDVAAERVDGLLDQIRGSGAFAGPQLLRVAAAEQRSPARAAAQRLVEGSDRVELVRDGRKAVREFLDRGHAQFNLGMYYGVSADPSTPRDRIEIAIALEDLVLATAVEDLLEHEHFAALATDGANLLLDIPNRSIFPSVAYAPAGDENDSTSGSIRVMQVTVVAVLVAGSLLAGALFGLIPALLGGCLVASIVASWIWRRSSDKPPQESETP